MLEQTLEQIKAAAWIRHEKARKLALKNGRKDFPYFPFECSWAFELQYKRDQEKKRKEEWAKRFRG